MQKSVRYNEGHALYLAFLARKEGTKRGFLSKKAAEASRWHEKWFALYQNVLFYFEGEQSGRPAGMYLLEGCSCERTPAPPRAGVGPAGARDALDKQYYFTVLFGHEGQKPLELRCEEEQDGKEWMEAIHQARYGLRSSAQNSSWGTSSFPSSDMPPASRKCPFLPLTTPDPETPRTSCPHRPLLHMAAVLAVVHSIVPCTHILSHSSQQDAILYPLPSLLTSIQPDVDLNPGTSGLYSCADSGCLAYCSATSPVSLLSLPPNPSSTGDQSAFLKRTYVPGRTPGFKDSVDFFDKEVTRLYYFSIFYSETIMFLHEIFHQGLKARIANWPTLILADLFDILLPMLNIYQEFVRNHQYSLQVLANCKQNRDFDKLLKQYEANPACEGRMLETFLTYPMFQIPRYIITLHELLAHTPHEHVERKSLEFAKSKLEELSRIMHDEVSDTENIRKNLAIERMIVEGCDILLDTSQTFIRQGSLIQVPSVERGKLSKVRLGSLSLKKEGERQCFLFTKHFLICTRSSGGKLHLLKTGGVLSLIECTLIEEPDASDDDSKGSGQVFGHLDFKIVVEPPDAAPFTVVLLAPSRQEKAAWTSDISQCVDNIRCNGLMTIVFEENSKVTVPHMIKSDARLHKDDTDICFSKTLNSCKVPQIRYASVERLLERLTDLRFLSIDFLNTFLHTYRIFTTAAVVLAKLSDIYKRPFTSIPVRSLELFFATSQNSRGEHLVDGKSPRLCRKFSSPPPLAVSRTSSPVRARKLSLTSPLNSRIGALDLTTCSASSSPTTTHSPAASPPPHTGKVPLDLSRGLPSPEQSPGSVEEHVDNPRVDLCNKLKRSIQRAVLESAPVDRAGVESSPVADSSELSPCRSPSTPQHLRYRQPVGQTADNSHCSVSPASAFAIATAAAGHGSPPGFNNTERTCDKEFIIRRTATNRVLNVLRHWVSKHAQDFELNNELKMNVLNLLEEVLRDPDLLPQERKATANILRALSQDDQDDIHLKLEDIIQLTDCPKAECFETLSAMELAEQITLLDHIIFRSIPYEEFLGQGWMKLDKNERTPYIMKTSQHFNDMSNLVASQIMNYADISSRANAIEKWVAVADICRCLHNYNGVLEITSALNRSAIYRLKKTWAKVSKQTKALMDKLQKTVSSEGRFKNLRETLKNCNPPAVPYLGMYLTDLAFIEEGTPNFTEEGLVNFSKMRMISHIIREIRQFQQTCYRIDHQSKVTQYLLDKALIIDEDTLYELSLKIEPRLPA
ncbi:ras-specific guanine nucleotide-releasing factor 2 [Panthera uncia]|uniref:ras-specific guanine nucleotide-releasing factor 2 n=1 Tax=Panthera uncia TaxID=29064 RepID=UPI0020FFAF03|nr:ras-specific guanine nucleotide-releasing factor 2 [Panthera uncia]